MAGYGFEKRSSDLPYEGEQMRKTLAKMQSALNFAERNRNWTLADRAWFAPEAHADDVEDFGIEVRMEVCGIGHDGKEVEQLIELLGDTAARLREYLQHRDEKLAELRERVRAAERQFGAIDWDSIWLGYPPTDCPATAPAGA